MTEPTQKIRRIDRFIFVLVIIALTGLWGVVAAFTYFERGYTLDQARSQLEMTVITLADFNELAQQATGEAVARSNKTRTAAIWRALLQYPAASIWVESDGVVTGGQAPAEMPEAAITAAESRTGFSVHAVLPHTDALAAWWQTVWQRAIALAVVTVAFLILTHFLIKSLRQRTAAEREAAAVQERNKQLALYRTQLEKTVAERTAELKYSNSRLEEELTERKTAERTLREHDALLSSVTKGAAELLGSHNHEDAITAVLELIGQTVAVSRVQLNVITPDRDGHLRMSVEYEWYAPGMDPVIDDLRFQNLDMTTHFPKTASAILSGGLATFFVEDISEKYRTAFKDADMRSFLQLPVYVEDRLWGSFTFIDSSSEEREWSWAETDTLKTLAGLIGVAMTRARYVKELADANMIVQNSPTILYRLKGEPSFPLIYISHNITKFGHKADDLVDTTDWMQRLVEPEDQDTVRRAMARMLESSGNGASIEFRLRTGDGDYRWVENRYTPVRDESGRLEEVEGIIIDITERKAAEEKIATLARTDALTGLANRATFIERLRQAFAATKRGANPFAILYLDLDHFKGINDTLGHPVGDELLKQVADRLRKSTRETDVVARLGGDEFAVLQMEITEPANAGALAQTIQTTLSRPYQVEGNELHVTTSIGICPYTPESTGPDNMLTQADLALYRSKEEGRNQYRFHSDDLDQQVLERTELAEDLRKAIENNELELVYQPQVAMATGEIVGVEALARWNHPEKGPLSPRDFIPVAEKTGTIMALGHWVLNEACRQLRAWRDEGIELPEITLNLSLSQLRNSRELVRDVADTTEKWGLNPSDIEFDVTEAMLAQATWTQNDVLAQLRQLGCKIAIDDFGTEYSSFDYLRSYSVNHLKIAQSFINKAIEDPERAATIRAIIHLARDLGIGVIAEGVETEEQRSLLLSIGQATHAQGYYYSKAVSPEAADEMLHRGHIAEKSKNKGRDENGKGGDKTDGDDDKGSDDDSGGSASQPAESGA